MRVHNADEGAGVLQYMRHLFLGYAIKLSSNKCNLYVLTFLLLRNVNVIIMTTVSVSFSIWQSVQSWAKERAHGCVNSPPCGQRESGGGFHATGVPLFRPAL